jgi:hypothetical protein
MEPVEPVETAAAVQAKGLAQMTLDAGDDSPER